MKMNYVTALVLAVNKNRVDLVDHLLNYSDHYHIMSALSKPCVEKSTKLTPSGCYLATKKIKREIFALRLAIELK